jgi:hypothetical protein
MWILNSIPSFGSSCEPIHLPHSCQERFTHQNLKQTTRMKLLYVLSLAIVQLSNVSAFSTTPFGMTASRRPSFALSLTAEKTETKQDIRVGVIGMGRIGLVHLEAITKAPGVVPVIVSNPTVSKAEKGKCKSTSHNRSKSLLSMCWLSGMSLNGSS